MPTVKNVAVLLNLSRVYDRQVIRGITRYVQGQGSWQLYVEENPADKVTSFTDWSGDGLIADTDDRRIAATVDRISQPLVGIGVLTPEERKRLPISTVNSDDATIAQWAADHLLQTGVKNFAYCGTRTGGLDRWVEIRRDCFRRRIAEHGFSCAVFAHGRYAPRRWERLLDGLKQWLTNLSKPVGIMACNDSRGRQVLEACRQLGLNVPDDVAVIGVDNDELMCELAAPPLSSILQGTEQIGFEAAKLLDQMMRRRRRPTHIMIPPACLVARQSTDLVAIDDAVVSEALRYIREHATERIGVLDIVRCLDVSRSTLETRFRRHLGRTVHDEIQRMRLDAAQRLLAISNLPLHAVAERAGYSSLPYMCAVFRRELGHPPGYFRRQAGLG